MEEVEHLADTAENIDESSLPQANYQQMTTPDFTQQAIEKIKGPKKISFALGGLAGFNGHGAGFLSAALEKNVKPDLISCTSGQIPYVATFLEARRGGNKNAIRKQFEEAVKTTHSPLVPFDWLNGPLMAFTGLPDVFKPAWFEYWQNFVFRLPTFEQTTNAAQMVNNHGVSMQTIQGLNEAWTEDLRDDWLNRIAPACLYKPDRDNKQIMKMAKAIVDEKEVGVMFNAYVPHSDEEIIYVNKPAYDLLKERAKDRLNRPEKTYDGTRIQLLERCRDSEGCSKDLYCEAIQAIEDALWLYFYGFEKRKNNSYCKHGGKREQIVDGAYHRQIILAELAPTTDVIYVVKPQGDNWKSKMPTNQLQIQNFKTQLWFNSSYSAERASIDTINSLLKKAGSISSYRPVYVCEIEYPHHIGFFDYFVEREEVYDKAYQNAISQFDRTEACRTPIEQSDQIQPPVH